MRIKQSASFPHPILAEATGDYGPNKFQLSLEVQEQAAAGDVHLTGKLLLDDGSILKLIEAGQAVSGLMIYCQGTYLDAFENRDLGDIELDLSGGKVRGPVHVRGVVVALQDGLKLDSAAISDEFPDESRFVDAGDLLAMTDELSFEAGLEKLSPMESIFRLKLHEELTEGVFALDLDDEAIGILAAPSLHRFLSLLREQAARDALLSSLYLPVVMSVLDAMHDEPDYVDKRWHSVMSARCNAEGIDLANPDLASAAQRLLDSPLGSLQRVFEKLGGA
ncbi:hypothetical protein [Luteimonas notoginsengisoli]|uniref:DUF748 domain-containing protein n=1 Tax=Luteimonas notoginsengisoli TaxID=1578200 RepID=A0ABV7UU67_9GAMM